MIDIIIQKCIVTDLKRTLTRTHAHMHAHAHTHPQALLFVEACNTYNLRESMNMDSILDMLFAAHREEYVHAHSSTCTHAHTHLHAQHLTQYLHTDACTRQYIYL